jgi:VanZ family protein
LWAGAIWFGSNLSIGEESPINFIGLDKLGHAIEFGILGLVAANALLTLTGRNQSNRSSSSQRESVWNGAVLIAALWGWLDEIHQFWVPGRNTDPSDLLADVIGAAIGAWVLLRWMRPAETAETIAEVER